jgi:hypothetical protein
MERWKCVTIISLPAVGILGTVNLVKFVIPTFRTFTNPNRGNDLMPDGCSEVYRVASLSQSALYE